MSDIPEIDIEAFARARETTAQVLDVREADEFAAGRVPGALSVPMSELQDRVSELDEGSEWLVICRSGGRSLKVCQFLAGRGYSATNVAGGTLAWINSGRDIELGS